MPRQGIYSTMDRNKEIRVVLGPESVKIVEKLADNIWREHYTSIIGEDQVNYMLNKFQSASAIEAQIEEGAQYYLIFYKDSAAGYFSYYFQDNTLFLSKIYVDSKFRGTGLGRFSMDFIEQQATESNRESITLTVNKNNTNTIAAYKKMGFEIEQAIIMDIGNGYVMDDYKMIKELK